MLEIDQTLEEILPLIARSSDKKLLWELAHEAVLRREALERQEALECCKEIFRVCLTKEAIILGTVHKANNGRGFVVLRSKRSDLEKFTDFKAPKVLTEDEIVPDTKLAELYEKASRIFMNQCQALDREGYEVLRKNGVLFLTVRRDEV